MQKYSLNQVCTAKKMAVSVGVSLGNARDGLAEGFLGEGGRFVRNWKSRRYMFCRSHRRFSQGETRAMRRLAAKVFWGEVGEDRGWELTVLIAVRNV